MQSSCLRVGTLRTCLQKLKIKRAIEILKALQINTFNIFIDLDLSTLRSHVRQNTKSMFEKFLPPLAPPCKGGEPE